MTRTITALLTCFFLLTGCASAPAAETAADSNRPPNVVFILADDLGVECLSLYGGVSHQTPNLDRLAAQGMRFTHCFSNPYCSPSRAELLTGRYPYTNGMDRVIFDSEQHREIWIDPATQPSIARQFQQAGYATAIAGKWQISFLNNHNTINALGFDTYQVWQIFTPQWERTTRFHRPHFNRDGTIIADQIADRYGPDVNAEFLSDFITQNAEADQPFLAYYTCLLPHFPWVPTPNSEDQSYRPPNSRHIGDPRYFPDMVAYLDEIVGRLMTTLEEAGVADNTVVIFVADNGTQAQLTNLWSENRIAVQGGKGTMTDRGTHVPLLVRWPGHIEPGSVNGELIDFVDFFPTLCDIADLPLPEQPLHGQSFLPQLIGQQGTPRGWVHVQDKGQRYLRSFDYILTNRGALRPVVGIADPPADPIAPEDADAQATAARQQLQQAFDRLGP